VWILGDVALAADGGVPQDEWADLVGSRTRPDLGERLVCVREIPGARSRRTRGRGFGSRRTSVSSS
jgi:hypothetical protein